MTAGMPGGAPAWIAGQNGDGYLRWYAPNSIGPPIAGTGSDSVACGGNLKTTDENSAISGFYDSVGGWAILQDVPGAPGGEVSYVLRVGKTGRYVLQLTWAYYRSGWSMIEYSSNGGASYSVLAQAGAPDGGYDLYDSSYWEGVLTGDTSGAYRLRMRGNQRPYPYGRTPSFRHTFVPTKQYPG